MISLRVMTCLFLALTMGASAQTPASPDADAFADPPVDVRPRAYWDWINGAVVPEQLTIDLEEMKATGMGGAQMWDTGALRNPDGMVPAGPPFMGPESVAAMRHSLAEAKRLGLGLGLLTSSGWNAGGAWVTPKYAGKNLYVTEAVVDGPGRKVVALPMPPTPEHCPTDDRGAPQYSRDVAILAFPENEAKTIADATSIHRIASDIRDGAVAWDVPEGRWRVMRFVCMNNGQNLIAPSPNANGLLIDFLDPEATLFHFQYILDQLGITPENSADIGLQFLSVESMELEQGIQWTDAFPSDFQRWAGYAIEPWLPVLAGWTIESPELSARFLYDYHKAISEQLIFSHYITGNEFLDLYGIDLAGEAGGPGPPIWNSCPVDALKALGNLDIPQGEFWIRHRNMFLVKEIASAAHIYGKPLVDAESFTTWRRWKDGPAVLKPIVDRAFCEGLNRITYHGFAYSPPEAGYPGRVYHAGLDMNPRVTWWSMARPFMDYLARCSYMLRQGRFVADVCYYYGDQAPNFWPAFHDVPEKPLLDGLGAGYDYDVVNTDVILNRMSVQDGRIVLPDGMSYAVLQLCDQSTMPLEVLQKIDALVEAGATVLGPKPNDVPGLNDHAAKGEQLRVLADALWDGAAATGTGRIVSDRTARQQLEAMGIGPDFSYAASGADPNLDYIHRTAGDADIYFVRNPSADSVEARCSFRVQGKRPSFWSPVDGHVERGSLYAATEAGTDVPLWLPPGGSTFVVFEPDAAWHGAAVQRNGLSLLPPPTLTLDDDAARLLVWDDGTYRVQLPDGKGVDVQVDDVPGPVTVSGPWHVRFPEGWGAPAEATFSDLHCWTEDGHEGIRFFSGTATYGKQLDLPESVVGQGIRVYLDLGEVRDVARVRLNGKDLGIVWTPPFRVEITDVAIAGENLLEVDVVNMWINRLTGDLGLPPDTRFCSTNEVPRANDIGGDELWHVQPSGLLGPVRIVAAREINVTMP